MTLNLSAAFAPPANLSPLVLADRLLSLAQDADRAGYRDAASRLVELVFAVMDHGADRSIPASMLPMAAAAISHRRPETVRTIAV